MPWPKWMALILPGALLAFGPGASAQQAASGDRCSGTLCDFYYGDAPATPAGPPPAPTAGATPLMVPGVAELRHLFSGGDAPPAAPASRPMLQVRGGGLVAAARGTPADPCTGTLCDLFYGTSTPWPDDRPAPQQAAVAPAEADSGANLAPQAPAPSDVVVRREPPLCAATAADPWRCYR